MQTAATERKKIWQSIRFPLVFLLLLWIVKVFETFQGVSLSFLGVYPLRLSGLAGIVLAPLVHADFDHLIANSAPLLILLTGMWYFYGRIALQSFIWIYLVTGLWVWVSARPAYHIGASGLIYGAAAFLFFSGVLRRHRPLMAISLLTVFLYGSIVWGILPSEGRISWEGHLMGFAAGVLMAYYFRNQGPQKKEAVWLDDDDDDGEGIQAFQHVNYSLDDYSIKYFFEEEE